MTKFRVDLKGFSNSDGPSITKTLTIDANNKKEAEALANKWCEDNSQIWSYDWYVTYVGKAD